MLKQAARSGKNFRSNYGKTSKTEDSCQKIMAKDARLVIYIATLTNPDKTYGWSPEKSPSIAIFSIFLCKKKRFYRIVLRDTLGQPVRFCPKNRKFQTSSPKNLSKTEKVLEENLFLQIVFPVVLKTGLEILTKALAEKPEHSIEKKSDCSFGLLDCSLDQFFWFFDEKDVSITSQKTVKKYQSFWNKTTSPQNVPWTA